MLRFGLFILFFFIGQASVWAIHLNGICSVEILSIKTSRALENGNKPLLSEYWLEVTLPDNWNLKRSNFEKTVWYRIDWRYLCDKGNLAPVALVLQSIQMAGEIYVNDQQLWRDQSLTEPLSRSWNMPRYWLLSDNYVHHGVNTFWIKAVSVPGQPIGLGSLYIGSPEKIYPLYNKLFWNSRTIILINTVLIIIAALLLFFIWMADKKKTAFGWYALSILFWLIFSSNFLTISPWPFSSSYFVARLNTIALLLNVICFVLFLFRFSKQKLPIIERFFWFITLFFVLLTCLARNIDIASIQILSIAATSIIFLFACIQPLCFGLYHGQKEIVLFSLGWLLVLGGYLYDILLLLHVFNNTIALSPYMSIIVTLLMICIIGSRHANYIKQTASFNDELSQSIAEAKQELAAVLKKEYALSMENARLQDRLQIANDLHDGLGGSIVHMMASIEMTKPSYSPKEVIAMLSLIRNDLRQAIDSGSSQSVKVPETPLEWLAPIRHRYSTLFNELGIGFHWNIEKSWQTVPTAIQCLALTRLIEEALTNVIKHSHAQFVEISLKLPKSDELVLTIDDNGRGFDVAAVAQSGMSVGMRSMKMRINRAGGSLEVTSNPGKTILIARLKL